ncbi:MAG: hypothetical protein OHK0057_18550 [Thermoflexibacter sp.]
MKTIRFFMFARMFTLLGLLSVGLFSGCQRFEDVGAFQEERKTYDLSGFTRVHIGSGSKVTIQQGAAFGVFVRGDSRNLDDLRVRVENGILKADYYPHNHRNRQYRTEFTITMPTLEGVDFSGATIANVGGFENSQKMYVRLSGASEGVLSIRVNEIEIDLSGASHLSGVGVSQKMKAEISGGAELSFFDFSVEEVQISASGGSKAQVNVSKTLRAEASGGSHIRYTGNPSSVSGNSSGGSSISRE